MLQSFMSGRMSFQDECLSDKGSVMFQLQVQFFEESATLFSRAAMLLQPYQQHPKDAEYPYPCQHLLLSICFRYSNSYVVAFYYGLNQCFLMINGVQHLFLCFLAVYRLLSIFFFFAATDVLTHFLVGVKNSLFSRHKFIVTQVVYKHFTTDCSFSS